MLAGFCSYLVILLLRFEPSTLAAGAWAVLVGVAAVFVAGYLTATPEANPNVAAREELA